MRLNEFEQGMTNLLQARVGWAKAEAYAHDVVEWMARQGLEVPGAASWLTSSGRETDDKFWDLADIALETGNYTDFEGFASMADAIRVLRSPIVKAMLTSGLAGTGLDPKFRRDMLIHWLYENYDQGNYEPEAEEAVAFLGHLDYILMSRRWLKVLHLDLAPEIEHAVKQVLE